MIKVEKTLSLHDIDLTADLYSYKSTILQYWGGIPHFGWTAQSHTQCCYWLREGTCWILFVCMCVSVYIYMNLSFIVPWTKILLILYCWYFTWSMWRSTMKLVDLLLQKLPVIIWVKQSMVNLNHKISLSLFKGETVLDIVLYTSFLVNISWTLCWTGIKLGNGT